MRTETEMFNLILSFAKSDERIRAVILNGSRTNKNAPIDHFMDYDIVYIVRDIMSFKANPSWIDIFGSRIILEMPENMRDPMGDGRLTYLMLFEDKNRIDLQVYPVESWHNLIESNRLTITLLDKDNFLPDFPPPSDVDFLIKKPSENDVLSTCTDFWWCLQNAAKGIYRDELSYVKTSIDLHCREQLHNMLDYYVGIITDFSVSIGKFGKYYKKYLPTAIYTEYQSTYADANYVNIWCSIFTMCKLFTQISIFVCNSLGYEYIDYYKMIDYLSDVKMEWENKSTLQT